MNRYLICNCFNENISIETNFSLAQEQLIPIEGNERKLEN